jgi:hypothetical protein
MEPLLCKAQAPQSQQHMPQPHYLPAIARFHHIIEGIVHPHNGYLLGLTSNLDVPLHHTPVHSLAAGGEVTLRDLYLGDVTLESPTAGDLNKVLLPVSIDLPIGAQLHLENVILEVSEQQLVEYVDFMRGVPYAPVWTVSGIAGVLGAGPAGWHGSATHVQGV